MATNVFQCVCCIIVLTFYVEQGDGRWKKKNRENLQHDIDVFKRMAENIEHEIDLYYEGTSDEYIDDDTVENSNQYIKKINPNAEKDFRGTKKEEHNTTDVSIDRIPNQVKLTTSESNEAAPRHVSFVNKFSNASTDNKDLNKSWPKFEDILSAMGKKYDWKNDRWIKVKRKSKDGKHAVKNDVLDTTVIHEKHKFSYRTVKLNRNKRRNIVIAVSAVR